MIELKAIIGARKGKIGDHNSSAIVSHLGVASKTCEDNGYGTNSDRLSWAGEKIFTFMQT